MATEPVETIQSRVPDDYDTAWWPSEFTRTMPLKACVSHLWRADRNLYHELIACLDSLAEHMALEGVKSYRREQAYEVFLSHYGLRPDEKKPATEPKPEKYEPPACESDHLRTLTEAARKVDPQPDTRDSARWAADNVPVVLNLGWGEIRPEGVIGLTALALLQRGVENPDNFYGKYLVQYSVKTKDKSGRDRFEDSGREQIEYAEKLEKRAIESAGGG